MLYSIKTFKPFRSNIIQTSWGRSLKVTKKWVLVGAILVIVSIASAAIYQTLQLNSANILEPSETLFQLQAFNLFSNGNFEGNTTFAELAMHGDFGIGTLNDLNGEMIALKGKFYQIPTDGSPRQIGSSEKTPYATVAFFEANKTFQVDGPFTYAQLIARINSTLNNYDAIYAINVHGYFNFAKTRSPPAQTKPYPTLTEAIKNQTVFALTGVYGTAAGFYFPASMNGVDSTGYHFHLITDDFSAGGHLLECTVSNATVETDQINNYHLQIP